MATFLPPRENLSRRVMAIFSLVVGAFYMCWKIHSMLKAAPTTATVAVRSIQQKHYTHDVRHRTLQQQTPTRPLVYTFYEPLHRAKATVREGRVQLADQALLDEWKRIWYEAGFSPHVLSLEDAQQHSDYVTYNATLSTVFLIGEGGRNREYNEYCFLRFLAMASVGGGLMADYDVFPLHMPLEPFVSQQDNVNYGSEESNPLTVHSMASNGQGGIPCLVSGSASEWTRMAHAILHVPQSLTLQNVTAATIATTQGWSDMLALMYLYQSASENTYILQDHVVGAMEYIKGRVDFTTCPPPNMWAMHFSHHDVAGAGHRITARAALANAFQSRWKVLQCETIHA